MSIAVALVLEPLGQLSWICPICGAMSQMMDIPDEEDETPVEVKITHQLNCRLILVKSGIKGGVD